MYNLKKGTKLFGKKAFEELLKELTEIDDFYTNKPVHKEDLSYKDRKNPLKTSMKITEKQEDKTGD